MVPLSNADLRPLFDAADLLFGGGKYGPYHSFSATFRLVDFSRFDGDMCGYEIGYYRSPLASAEERIPPSPPLLSMAYMAYIAS